MLPSLRRDLDLMPSPVDEQPGLLMRDPKRYSDAIIVVPWVLARCLDCFDGQHTQLDLREALVRATGQLDVSAIQDHLTSALRESGFLEDDAFYELRERREREFAAEEHRAPSHGGSAYPEDRDELNEVMRGYIDPRVLGDTDVAGIAAPHVSPSGGWQSYQAAYRKLPRDVAGRTVIILGTSHYGTPDKFGLTRKGFETPLGISRTDHGIVDRLQRAAPGGVTIEDYCHSVEHSIEFQVLFLQWLYGPDISIVPILCGSFANSIYRGGMPEQNEGVARFLDGLRDVAEAAKGKLLWILGIDMAHIGRRYGDSFAAHANRGYLAEVAERDQARNDRVMAGDAGGFWDLVQAKRDDLRWCGSSPLYTFLKAVPGLRGTVERYEQWNIDEASVVSFAGMSFKRESV